jgi:GNAT superfamily N-acetyltransferase
MPVSTLDASSVSAYRDLMLEAYEHAADAFTTTAAERRAEPQSWWEKRIGSSSGIATSFGVWDGPRLVGTVAVEYSAKLKTRHTALVLGMYVTPSHRGKGLGRSLVEAAIAVASARPEVVVLTLTLTEGNEPALRLYRAAGFAVWGIKPMAIRTESGIKGKIHMSLALRQPSVAT